MVTRSAGMGAFGIGRLQLLDAGGDAVAAAPCSWDRDSIRPKPWDRSPRHPPPMAATRNIPARERLADQVRADEFAAGFDQFTVRLLRKNYLRDSGDHERIDDSEQHRGRQREPD